jgi:predicted small lipoprotein YifL
MSARLMVRPALLILLVLLAACGKKAAPEAPGPTDQIIYPRSYPTH